eukprot:TRINITY_DN6056_c0_g2_i2.p1 TRINITY_DN6056_c0_g2~~TRINITY_DN6056_c0_g2_i2.p1  ORF type:complete len:544 (+),score=165.54 TRINITY_DN6056_c0_g2_i2:245-1876(+)
MSSPSLPTNYGHTGFGKGPASPTLPRAPAPGANDTYGTLPSALSPPMGGSLQKRDTLVLPPRLPQPGANDTYGTLPSALSPPPGRPTLLSQPPTSPGRPAPSVNDTYGTLPSALSPPPRPQMNPPPPHSLPPRPQMSSSSSANDTYGTLPSTLSPKLTSSAALPKPSADSMYASIPSVNNLSLSSPSLPSNLPPRPSQPAEYLAFSPPGLPTLPNNIPGRPSHELPPGGNYGSFPAPGLPTLPTQAYGSLPPAKTANPETNITYGVLPSATKPAALASGTLPSPNSMPNNISKRDTMNLSSPTLPNTASKRDTMSIPRPPVDQNYGSFPVANSPPSKELAQSGSGSNRKPPLPPGSPVVGSPPNQQYGQMPVAQLNAMRRVTSIDNLFPNGPPSPVGVPVTPRREISSMIINEPPNGSQTNERSKSPPKIQSAASRQINGSTVAGRSSSSPTINPAARLIAESSVGLRSHSSPESSPHGSPGHSFHSMSNMKKIWKSAATPSRDPTSTISLSSNRSSPMRSITSPPPFSGQKLNRPTSFVPRS